MRISRLEIQNFRGIRSLELHVAATTILIGENNTGKTAILDALRFALREVRSRRGCKFDEYDFHLPDGIAEPATAPAISIRLTFQENIAGEWERPLAARLNRAKILQVDSDGRSCVILKVGGRFDATSQEFVQDWEFQNLDGAALTGLSDSALGTLHSEISYHYLAALRDATRQFDAKGPFWRPFLKESQLTPETRAEIEQKLSEVNDLIISSHASFSQVVEHLKEVKDVVSVIGMEDPVSIDAVPARLFDMLSKAAVSLKTVTGVKIPVGRHGEGTQSLAVLTLFSAYLQAWGRGSPIIALEEPEAHLHPSAVRALWPLIEKLPGQKIISTHSGDLLSEVDAKDITRLHTGASGPRAFRFADIELSDSDTRKFNFHIRSARGELMFSRCWILGEGETDSTLILESARILNKNLERAGVRFVTYQTGASLETCLQIANGLGIQWVVLADNDAQGAKDRDAVIRHLNGRNAADVLFVMPEDNIEQHLCVNGFVNVYFKLLGEQPQRKVTSKPGDRTYPIDVAKALPGKLKTQAAQEVIVSMQENGKSVPKLFEAVIDAALKTVEAI